MVQSPSWEANWFAASQEIPLIFMEPEGSLPHSQAPVTGLIYLNRFKKFKVLTQFPPEWKDNFLVLYNLPVRKSMRNLQ